MSTPGIPRPPPAHVGRPPPYGSGLHVNPWVAHIRAFAAKHNLTYGCALSNPDCRASYKSKRPTARQLLGDVEGIESADLAPMTTDLDKRLRRTGADAALDATLRAFGYE